MSLPSTPKKAKTEAVAPSPSSKATLDFDFWAERLRKVPTVVEADLLEEDLCQLKDLEVGRLFEKGIKVRCLQVTSTASVFKVAFQDESGIMIAVAFKEHAKVFEHVQTGKWYTLSKFDVKGENPEFLTGALNNLQMIVWADATVIKEVTMEDEVPPKVLPLSVVKKLEDNSLVDVLCICVKDWGQSISATGSKRWQLTLTDASMESIRLTLWGDVGSKLMECLDKTVLLKHASVGSYEGVKFLQSKWFTQIETQPAVDEAYELKRWYDEKMKDE